MNEFIKDLGLLINAMLIATPPLLYAALGSCISERSGVVNIGIEGMMTVGAFTGAALCYFVPGAPWLAFVLAGVAGALVAVIHAFACITCNADQTISGTAINFLAPGIAIFICRVLFSDSTDTPAITDSASRLPKLLDGVFPAGSFWNNVLNIRLSAVGEHPQACDTLGINVTKTRYIAVILSGFFSGLGGAYITMATTNQFRPAVIVGQGFMAISAVIFGKFTPQGALLACMLFGLCSGVKVLAGTSNIISPNLISMIPYIVTILALVLFVGRARVPAANGKPYIKSK